MESIQGLGIQWRGDRHHYSLACHSAGRLTEGSRIISTISAPSASGHWKPPSSNVSQSRSWTRFDTDPDLGPEATTPVIYGNGHSRPEQRDRHPGAVHGDPVPSEWTAALPGGHRLRMSFGSVLGPTSVIYGNGHSRPEQRDRHPAPDMRSCGRPMMSRFTGGASS